MRPGVNLGTSSSSSSALNGVLVESWSEIRFLCTDECRTSSGDRFLDPRMEAASADVVINIEQTTIVASTDRFIMNKFDRRQVVERRTVTVDGHLRLWDEEMLCWWMTTIEASKRQMYGLLEFESPKIWCGIWWDVGYVCSVRSCHLSHCDWVCDFLDFESRVCLRRVRVPSLCRLCADVRGQLSFSLLLGQSWAW